MMDIVILAAGKGTRMRSHKAKVLHTLAGKTLLDHVVDRAEALAPRMIHVVVGHQADEVKQALQHRKLEFCEQQEQLGTGHAVLQALPSIPKDAKVLVLYGDVPLIKTQTLVNLAEHVDNSTMALLTVELEDPTGYGRIVRNAEHKVTQIVEQKDANAEQLKINEVNTGVMCVPADLLKRWLPSLSSDNAQGEYYLTDILALANSNGVGIATSQATSNSEVLGVNSRLQQTELERIYQREQAEKFLDLGLSIKDISRFDCRGDLFFGQDCEVDINCVFEGAVTLGDNVKIGPNCVIKNSNIASGTSVHEHSSIDTSTISETCQIGPFARLRPGTHLAANAKIGNFVETKNANLGAGTKINHLSYVGDADLGSHVNIGAGTITCNYDGANKHRTLIGDNVFVGSNSALVAPVNLQSGSTIGAGSTITQDVNENALSLTRAKQRQVSDWSRPTKKKK